MFFLSDVNVPYLIDTQITNKLIKMNCFTSGGLFIDYLFINYVCVCVYVYINCILYIKRYI